jgi:hypothetical protein
VSEKEKPPALAEFWERGSPLSCAAASGAHHTLPHVKQRTGMIMAVCASEEEQAARRRKNRVKESTFFFPTSSVSSLGKLFV